MYQEFQGKVKLSDIKIQTFYEVRDGLPDSKIPNILKATHIPTGFEFACPIMEDLKFTRGYVVRALESLVGT